MSLFEKINACLFDNENQQWLKFHSPRKVLSTSDPKQVLPVIAEMELLVKRYEYYAVGFVSYEAANGLNPSLITYPTSSHPLAWFALFEWSVARQRWPVSENVIAASIVSRSRISPINTTSGACRRAFFNAVA